MDMLSRLKINGVEPCSDLTQVDCSIFHPISGYCVGQVDIGTQKSVLSRSQSTSIKLHLGLSQTDCSVFEPASGSSPAGPALVEHTNPLVSCLMMAGGNIEVMKYSLACYQRQTYTNRELVVVAGPEAGDKVRSFIDQSEALNVAVFVAPPGLTIGDHRNLAAARARGAILVTWDDDDLSDPRRLDTAVQVLRQTGAAAAFLSRLVIWWPQRKVAAISRRRLWEQSIAAWRSCMPIYAPVRGGDSVAINQFISAHIVAQVDCPFLYVYAVTGENRRDAAHFEGILSNAECIFEGDQFDELNEHLSDRLPVLEYAALLKDKGAFKILR